MSKNKQPQVPKKNDCSIGRSSAAEYLTFIAASGSGGVEALYADENVWLTQKMMGLLYDIETQTINYHLKKVFADSELEENSVIRNFRITAADGKNGYPFNAGQAIGRNSASVLRRKLSTAIGAIRLCLLRPMKKSR